MEKLKNKIYNLLKWSEQHTATDMIYLARGGFWLTLGQNVSAASSFILAIAFANLLPKETFGLYKYVLSIVGILAISTLPGINTAIIQAVARGYEGSFMPSLKTKIQFGFLGGLLSLFLALYYYLNDNNNLALLFMIPGFFIPFMDSLSLYNYFLQGQKNFRSSTIYGIVSFTGVSVFLILVLFVTKNIFLITLAYFLLWTLFRLFFLIVTLRRFPPKEEKTEETISYGKHLTLMDLFPLIAQQLDKILIFHYLGPVQLAVYNFAIAVPEQIKAPFKNLKLLILLRFSVRETEEIKMGLLGKILKMSGILIGVVLIYFFIAPFLYKLFFPQYLESIFYSRIFALSIIFTSAILPLSFLQSKLAIKELYRFNALRAVFQFILLFVLIFYFGIIGAVVSRISADFLNLAVLIFLAKKLK